MKNYTESQKIVFDTIETRLKNSFGGTFNYNTEVTVFKNKKLIIRIVKKRDNYGSDNVSSLIRGMFIDRYTITFDILVNVCLDNECFILNQCWKNYYGKCFNNFIDKFYVSTACTSVLAEYIMDKLVNKELYSCKGCESYTENILDLYCDSCLYHLTSPECFKCSICLDFITITNSTVAICGDSRHAIHKKCFLQLVDKYKCPICRIEI